jgi:hypothetical protein
MLATNVLRHVSIVTVVMAGTLGPVKAADDGDCCSNLEDRIANLKEKTNKGHDEVSVTVSGWVTKSMDWLSDGTGQPSKHSQQR